MKQLRLIPLVFLLLIQWSFGQTPQVQLSVDSNNILIGDHLPIQITATVAKEVPIIIPTINQELFTAQEVPYEWIESSKIDTQYLDNIAKYTQIITITAFDSGSYVFPSVPILGLDSNLLAQSNAIQFHVTTFPVDTTAAIKDIKENVNTPFTMHELWLYIQKYYPIILIFIILIAIVIYLIIRYKKRMAKQKAKVVVKQKPKVKADVKALKALQQLKNKKLWEQGKVKAYYSELTDILRTYMEDRWEVYAMEMTTSEILEALNVLELESSVVPQLKNTLELSDLVKFAKCDPLPDEHNTAFKTIQHFVEKTKEINTTSTSKKN